MIDRPASESQYLPRHDQSGVAQVCVSQLAPSENQDSIARLTTRRFPLSQNLPGLVSVDLAEQVH